MSRLDRWRLALGTVGLLVVAFGVYRLLLLGGANLLATLPWLVGGAVVHDALIAPAVLLLGALSARALPPRLRPSALTLLLVAGATVLVAVPAIGRFGARPDNPSLLDRPYAVGVGVVLGLALLGAAVQSVRHRRKEDPGG